MRLVSLSIKNYKEIAASLQQKNQLFPFSLSNEKARQLFLAGVKEQPQKQNQVALEVNDKLVGFISYELTDTTLVLTHILKQPSFAKGLHFWVELLENLAKKKQLKQLSLCVKPYDSYLKERLVVSGFDFVETSQGEWLFTRAISYKTGLVLAGGGARGAYQIGAWRALKELGITYDVICGTSVGALNGAFILQDDFAAAAELWGQIDTNQLLSFPEADFADKSSVEGMLVNMQRFAKSALATQGVSTEPLQQLIKKHLKPAEINQGAPELFICTTQLPQLREVVISFKATPVTEFPQWLLASSSFFPAMAATKIAGSYYVDGGYRNNIPVDVAVEQGATEIIVVNVKGPGITKPYTLPQGLPVVTVASPWSLGTVLLFDGSRSHWNMELGYLETMKAFDHYIGYWYTFNHQFSDGMLTRWYDLFNQQILEGAGTKTNNALIIQEILKKTRKLYSERGTQEMVSLYVLEFVAKVLEITPAKLYTIPELLQAMQMKLRTGWLERNPVEEEILLSLSEWLRHYANNLPLPTEKQQVLYLYHQLKHEHSEHLLNLAATVAPHIYLAAKTLSWLEATEGDIIDGTRI